MLGFLQALQAQADLQRQSLLRNPSSALTTAVALAVIATLQKLVDTQMLKLFAPKDYQSK
jgi:hypothetical protein